MQIIDRKTAKAAGLTQYYTGKPCANHHVAYRYTTSGTCAQCISDASGRSRQPVKSRGLLDPEMQAAAVRAAQLVDQRIRALQTVTIINIPATLSDLPLILDTAIAISIAREPTLTRSDLAAGQRANKDAPFYKVKVTIADVPFIRQMADGLYAVHSRPPDLNPVRERLEQLRRIEEDKPLPEWVNRP